MELTGAAFLINRTTKTIAVGAGLFEVGAPGHFRTELADGDTTPLYIGNFGTPTGDGQSASIEFRGLDSGANQRPMASVMGYYKELNMGQLRLYTANTDATLTLGMTIDQLQGVTMAGTAEIAGYVTMTGLETGLTASGVFVRNAAGEIGLEASSERYKDNIRSIEVDTSKIYDLVGKTFETKAEGLTQHALIAEDVYEYFPEMVYVMQAGTVVNGVTLTEDRIESIYYDKLTVPIIEEMKKLKTRIEVLEKP